MRILESVLEVNRKQRELVLQKLEEALEGLSNKRVGILGLSFKPNTDDVRESPGIAICKRLVEKNAQVLAYDPLSIPNAKKVLNGNGVSYCRDAYEAVTNCDAVLVATEWNEFRNIDLERIKSLMRNLVILDPRNIFDPEKVEGMGFKYFGTGRARS
jgi:UDPglucose 6-dehydrogenase